MLCMPFPLLWLLLYQILVFLDLSMGYMQYHCCIPLRLHYLVHDYKIAIIHRPHPYVGILCAMHYHSLIAVAACCLRRLLILLLIYEMLQKELKKIGCTKCSTSSSGFQ